MTQLKTILTVDILKDDAASIMVGLSFWAISTYLLWVLGFKLQIGTIQNGQMDVENI